MDQSVAEIASLREQIKYALRRIETLEENVKMIPKIETLLEITIETNKKQSDTLSNINSNLIRLNNNYDNLTNRIGTIEDGLRDNRKDSSININKLITDTIFKAVPALILAWLVIEFGLK